MTDASGSTTYSYDSADRLTSKATPAGTLSYTYDAAGNVASIASSNTTALPCLLHQDALNRRPWWTIACPRRQHHDYS